MTGDPPLNQVVSRTWEAGARGACQRINWTTGVFRADNRDDILFVTSEQTGFGYFRNFGQTRRKGVELDAHRQVRSITIGAEYTFPSATYESPEAVDGQGNSTNDAAADGEPGRLLCPRIAGPRCTPPSGPSRRNQNVRNSVQC
jgi:outer membrane cobalamin receptor